MKQGDLSRRLMKRLEAAGREGIVPSEMIERMGITGGNGWEQVEQTILDWQGSGKITCLQKSHTTYVSRYALTKYVDHVEAAR